MQEYQGYRSWNAWNVSLWIANDESLYFAAVEAYKRAKTEKEARRKFIRDTCLLGDKTPDGAVYNVLCIKIALDGLELECGRA